MYVNMKKYFPHAIRCLIKLFYCNHNFLKKSNYMLSAENINFLKVSREISNLYRSEDFAMHRQTTPFLMH